MVSFTITGLMIEALADLKEVVKRYGYSEFFGRFNDEDGQFTVEFDCQNLTIRLRQKENVDVNELDVEVEGTGGFILKEWVFKRTEWCEVFHRIQQLLADQPTTK